jgi:hypothetical protein
MNAVGVTFQGRGCERGVRPGSGRHRGGCPESRPHAGLGRQQRSGQKVSASANIFETPFRIISQVYLNIATLATPAPCGDPGISRATSGFLFFTTGNQSIAHKLKSRPVENISNDRPR